MWCTQPASVEVQVGAGSRSSSVKISDQPPVARIEIEMAFGGLVEVGLLEDEGHAEHAFPEVDRGPAVRADERDVVHALGLKLLHSSPRDLP